MSMHVAPQAPWRRAVREVLFDLATEPSNDAVRFQALRCLSSLAEPGCESTLYTFLDDPDEDVRASAIEALVAIPDAVAESALLRTLRSDPSLVCKLAALEGLGQYQGVETLALLTELVVGPGEDVKWDDSDLDGWDDWLDVQITAIDALSAMGIESAVPAIEVALHDECSQELADVACPAFVRLGVAGQDAIKRCLTSARPRLQRAAMAAIQRAPHPRFVGMLEDTLGDSDPQLRASAFAVLVKLGQGSAHLNRMLGDPAPVVVVTALQYWTGPNTTVIEKLSIHQNTPIRVAVAQAIAGFAGEEVSEVTRTRLARLLPALLNDRSTEVVRWAVTALGVLGQAKSLRVIDRILSDEKATTPVRVAAVDVLRAMGHPTALELLDSLAQDSDWQIRRAALAAMAARAIHGDREARSILCSRLSPDEVPAAQLHPSPAPEPSDELPTAIPPSVKDEEPAISTLDTIIRHEDSSTAPPGIPDGADDHTILDALRLKPKPKHIALAPDISASIDAARFAAHALGRCPGAESVTALLEALDYPDEEVKGAALDSLLRIWTKATSLHCTHRVEALACDPQERAPHQVAAARLLMQLAHPAGEPASRTLLEGNNITITRLLLQRLYHQPLPGDRNLTPMISRLLNIPALRAPATKALAVLDPEQVPNLLLDLLNSGDGEVYQAIEECLEQGHLSPELSVHALLGGLRDPQWHRRRIWLLEVMKLGLSACHGGSVYR